MSNVTDLPFKSARHSDRSSLKDEPKSHDWVLGELLLNVGAQIGRHHRETGCTGCPECNLLYLAAASADEALGGKASYLFGAQDDAAETGVTVRVTTQDLSTGDPRRGHLCPIVQAMNRATRRKWTLNRDGATLIDVLTEHEVTLEVPRVVLDKVTHLEAGSTLAPFVFQWDIDVDALPAAEGAI